jgi:hypothetical protein
MASSIAGMILFASGPERFVVRPVGTLFLPPLALDALQFTTQVIAPLELRIEQTGRLVGDDGDDLWDQVESIRTQAEAQLTGTLVLPSGRTFSNMTLLRMEPEGPIERGRKVSLSYSADYIRLA